MLYLKPFPYLYNIVFLPKIQLIYSPIKDEKEWMLCYNKNQCIKGRNQDFHGKADIYMIFYFTGTGNSYWIAKKTEEVLNERCINISEALKNGNFEYILDDNEKIGFVFPVYYYTVPQIVKEFIGKLRIKNPGYAYCILTCGGSPGFSISYLKRLLYLRGIDLKNGESIVMPDNTIIYYDTDSDKKIDFKLQNSEIIFDAVINAILEHKVKKIRKKRIGTFFVNYLYEKLRKTKKFNYNNSCTGCGFCAKICPENVISIENKRPVWNKAKCSHCVACINRCPFQGIEYGKRTIWRRRYVHTILKNGK